MKRGHSTCWTTSRRWLLVLERRAPTLSFQRDSCRSQQRGVAFLRTVVLESPRQSIALQDRNGIHWCYLSRRVQVGSEQTRQRIAIRLWEGTGGFHSSNTYGITMGPYSLVLPRLPDLGRTCVSLDPLLSQFIASISRGRP